MNDQLGKKPWHKTVGGVIVLVLLSIILAIVLLFVGYFVYYSIQVKYGDINKINKQFASEKNTQVSKTDKINLGTPIANWQKLIKENNATVGLQTAPITIIEFIDFECPKCIEAYPIFKNVMAKYEPVIKVVFKNLPFDKTHPSAVAAANAAACAKEQGKFWLYYKQLFERQDLTTEGLLLHASDVGADVEKFSTCVEKKTYQKEINVDLMDAANLKLLGTPSYIVNGYKIEGVISEEIWDKIITQLLQK